MIMTGEINLAGEGTTIVAVIDAKTLATGERHACTRFDINGVTDLPLDALVRLRERARYVAAVVDPNGKVIQLGRKVATTDELLASLTNPVKLDHGRTRRLADANQHLAKRVMYRTCVIPGCRVPAGRCELHHVHEWEHGGPTDLDNLVPTCPYHHDRIHTDGWTLELKPDRSLIIRKQGVVLMATGPPAEQWAA